jgi:hypothetical protein
VKKIRFQPNVAEEVRAIEQRAALNILSAIHRYAATGAGRVNRTSAVEVTPQLFWACLKAAEPSGQESRLLFPSRRYRGWVSAFRKADVVTTNPLESEP